MRPRVLPALVALVAALAVVKLEALWREASAPSAAPAGWGAMVAPARASGAAPAPAQAAAPPQPPAASLSPPAQPAPDPQAEAERALLESLRQRRLEIEAREAAFALREAVMAAAERRIAQRLDEVAAIQQRIEAAQSGRGEREEAAWRGLVRTYETMRPRDAAAIFDEMEPAVLVQILDRMGERRAAPVIGAMRPERARAITTELARHRTRRAGGE